MLYHERPVGIVVSDRRRYDEPRRELNKQRHVCPPLEARLVRVRIEWSSGAFRRCSQALHQKLGSGCAHLRIRSLPPESIAATEASRHSEPALGNGAPRSTKPHAWVSLLVPAPSLTALTRWSRFIQSAWVEVFLMSRRNPHLTISGNARAGGDRA
jgi:hypothetical protein